MIVWNEFLHDARVTKEAETLTQAGYSVRVIALHDRRRTKPWETHTSGFAVRRVGTRVYRSAATAPKTFGDTSQRRAYRRNKCIHALRNTPALFWRMTWSSALRAHAYLEMLIEVCRDKPIVVHAHDANTLHIGWLGALLSGAKLVYDAHEISTNREGYGRVRLVVWMLERLFAPRAAMMITTTQMRADFFATMYPVRDVLVLQNRPRYSVLPAADLLRAKFQIRQSTPIVLYQGGVQPGRGLQTLVRVAERIPYACFVILGNGIQVNEIQDLVEEKGLTDRVFLHPAVSLNDLPKYTASATVGVQILENTCLNHYSTDSNKLFEYIMAGLPVLASSFPEMRKIVEDYGVGICVDPHSIQAVSDGLEELLENQSTLERRTQKCIEAAKILSWETQEQKLVNAYASLVPYDNENKQEDRKRLTAI